MLSDYRVTLSILLYFNMETVPNKMHGHIREDVRLQRCQIREVSY